MSDPAIVNAIAIVFGSVAKPEVVTRNQPYLLLNNGIKQNAIYDCIEDVAVGSFCDFPFEIGVDSWVDPETKLHYFKPCGRTFGSQRSSADFAFDGFRELFFALYGNLSLQLYNTFLNEVARTTCEADWNANYCLALPRVTGATSVQPGIDADSGFTWSVGKSGGTSQYAVKLPLHNHDLQQTSHSHAFLQKPHKHSFDGQTYDKDASESGGGSGSAKSPLAGESLGADVNLQLEDTLTDVRALASGTISDKIKIQNRGVGMWKMIFSGVIDA